MSVLVDRNTRVIVQGLTGREGSFHAQQMIDYGTKVVAGVTPGKGGTSMSACPCSTPSPKPSRETGANASRDFRSAAICGGCDSGSHRCGFAARHLHHGRHPGARYGARRGRAERFEDAPDRTKLPGNHFARAMQDRHHARLHPQAGQRRRREPQRHAHLRSRGPAYAARHRAIDVRRHRRRPDHRHVRSSMSFACSTTTPRRTPS